MRLSSKIGEQNGAAATEFAIVLPLLIVLVFGIIEFSILLYDKAMITNASREGARAGIVYAYPDRISDDDITAVINTYCSTHLITFSTGARLPPTITILRTGTSAGDSLTVTVKYKYDFLVLPNFIASLVGGIEIAGETIMRME